MGGTLIPPYVFSAFPQSARRKGGVFSGGKEALGNNRVLAHSTHYMTDSYDLMDEYF
ncbi:hypothetical protein HMPREF3293_01593 [Christensenella minuta]|jgi:hypothetical protein|uniref:Uncharacterized protein n=1 Tax=Christensenella minuta TaxID=626937 RepID=A0A136Q3Y7_9FIRM|nr:hypothetical protein HMPREF3293_01593 [Christensenella minuta]